MAPHICGLCIPVSFTVCPYCITPLVFTPALADGAPRRMPTAAAAVAMAVPLGGLPVPTERETEQMFTAVVNGPRQSSANAEFRRKIKDNLMYRA
eukprot:13570855-Heterocapsa_arctica.AAC.1